MTDDFPQEDFDSWPSGTVDGRPCKLVGTFDDGTVLVAFQAKGGQGETFPADKWTPDEAAA